MSPGHGDSGEDLAAMDDPAFLVARARARTLIDATPRQQVTPGMLAHMAALEEEFIRRARSAWQAAAPGGGRALSADRSPATGGQPFAEQ